MFGNTLVTGANGQLGSEIRKLKESANNYFFTDILELDITKQGEVRQFVKENNINIIVNCAAYTNVDRAEEEKELADLINRSAVQNFVEICEDYQVSLIQISTDYVFGGLQNIPYKETDKTAPLGVYGRTKLEAEEAIMASNINSLILRTSWLYSSYGNNFVKSILQLSSKKEELCVVFDQIGTPTYAEDLASFIVYVINEDLLKKRKQLYHFSNEGVCSWYDFAKEIVTCSENKCNVVPCHSDEFPTKVARPSYSVLDKTKLRQDFGYFIPYWRDSLLKCLKKIKE